VEISLTQKGVLRVRGVFLANHLASTDNLTRSTKWTEHIQTQTIATQKVAIINSKKHSKT